MEITRQNKHQRNLRLRMLANGSLLLESQRMEALLLPTAYQLHTQMKITRQNQHQRNIYDCICLQVDLYRLKANE
jgi:hypothetical protein